MLHESSLTKHTQCHDKNQLHYAAHHKTQTVRGTELVQHTEPCAVGHSEGGAVKDPGHLVERSEPGVQLIHPTGTMCSLGDGSETRQIHQRLSGYFLNIGTRTETLLKVKPNLV